MANKSDDMKIIHSKETEETLGWTVDEAAQLLRIGRNTAYTAVKTGEIPSIRVGERIIIPKVALQKKLEKANREE